MVNSCFYKKSWNITGSLIVLAVQEFQATGRLLGQVNTTAVTLMPKVPNPSFISEYRPISCCNVLYKLIIKVPANRLKSLLPDLIVVVRALLLKGGIFFKTFF